MVDEISDVTNPDKVRETVSKKEAIREYFVKIKETGHVPVDTLMHEKKDAEAWIRESGEVNVEYIIGYTVTYPKVYIKSLKPTLSQK